MDGGTQAGSLLSCRVNGSPPLMGPGWLLGCQLAFHPAPQVCLENAFEGRGSWGALQNWGFVAKGQTVTANGEDWFFFFFFGSVLPCPALPCTQELSVPSTHWWALRTSWVETADPRCDRGLWIVARLLGEGCVVQSQLWGWERVILDNKMTIEGRNARCRYVCGAAGVCVHHASSLVWEPSLDYWEQSSHCFGPFSIYSKFMIRKIKASFCFFLWFSKPLGISVLVYDSDFFGFRHKTHDQVSLVGRDVGLCYSF